jgi:hypothetical protein
MSTMTAHTEAHRWFYGEHVNIYEFKFPNRERRRGLDAVVCDKQLGTEPLILSNELTCYAQNKFTDGSDYASKFCVYYSN